MPSTEHKRIVVTGATGLIGTALCAALIQQGKALIVLSRDPEAARANVPGAQAYVPWKPAPSGTWRQQIDGAEGVIHLAGGPLFTFGKRHNQASVRQETYDRIRAIQGLVAAMEAAAVKPAVFISASSVGTYGYSGFTDERYTESSPPGADFWGQDSLEWEEAALAAAHLGVRTVLLRTGYVLDASRAGGLARQAAQFQRGFGGPVLPGKQWVPWIHLADEVGLIQLALSDERVRGPLNCTAPEVSRNREFAAALGKVLGKPARMAVPGFAMHLALGVVADILIHGRQVVPQKALDLGYQFQFPTLESALRDLLLP